jgi:transposase
MSVMIGIDPHKAAHVAVAVDGTEATLAATTVRATPAQADRLRNWADRFDERTWAVEGASGLGLLVAKQLMAAGERVLDVPPALAARVRVLGSGASDKTDRNDARAAAICALRDPTLRVVVRRDHTATLALAAKRHRDLSQRRTVQANRLHALLLELTPGGQPGRVAVTRTSALLDRLETDPAIDVYRLEIARELLDDIETLRLQVKASTRRLDQLVKATGTTLTEIRGIGPVGAATILGAVGNVERFPTRDRFAAFNGTAPLAASSGPHVRHRLNPTGNRRINSILHIAAVNQLRCPGPGRAYYDRKIAEGKTSKEAIRALKRQLSNVVYHHLEHDAARHHN